jgi:hypothetical protein
MPTFIKYQPNDWKNKDTFTTIDGECFDDNELSIPTLGFLVKIKRLPDLFDFSVKNITDAIGETMSFTSRKVKELEDLHYLVRLKLRDENGYYLGTKYVISYTKLTLAKIFDSVVVKELINKNKNIKIAIYDRHIPDAYFKASTYLYKLEQENGK